MVSRDKYDLLMTNCFRQHLILGIYLFFLKKNGVSKKFKLIYDYLELNVRE